MFRVFRRPEVKQSRLVIDKPLSGLVKFFEHIHKIEPLVLPKSINAVRRTRLYQMLVNVQGNDLFVGISPVVGPITVNPKIARVAPTQRTITVIAKPARQCSKVSTVLVALVRRWRIPRNLREFTLVGPTSECHRAMVEEQFAMS